MRHRIGFSGFPPGHGLAPTSVPSMTRRSPLPPSEQSTNDELRRCPNEAGTAIRVAKAYGSVTAVALDDHKDLAVGPFVDDKADHVVRRIAFVFKRI